MASGLSPPLLRKTQVNTKYSMYLFLFFKISNANDNIRDIIKEYALTEQPGLRNVI